MQSCLNGKEVQGLADSYEVEFDILIIFANIANIYLKLSIWVDRGEGRYIFYRILDHCFADIKPSAACEVRSNGKK
jgi:hypothetical protein